MKTQPKTSRIVKGFLGYLTESNQHVLLPQVARELHNMVDADEKTQKGVVTSPQTLEADQMAKIGQTVKKFFGREIALTQKIDKGLLGGFTIRVGDWFVDASLAHDIAEIKQLVLS
jgi:F-type H+-transporting ATPase subunit delta